MGIVLLTVAVFAIAMLVMAIGVIMRRPCLRGSCGGPEVMTAGGESLSCATCPNRKKRKETARASLPVV